MAGSSSSGSDDSTEEQEDDEAAKHTYNNKQHQFLKHEAAAAQETREDKPKLAKTHKVAFLAQQVGGPSTGTVISVWRCLLEGEASSGNSTSEHKLALQQVANNTSKWSILLCSGGR